MSGRPSFEGTEVVRAELETLGPVRLAELVVKGRVESANYRRKLREEESRNRLLADALVASQRQTLRLWLRGRMADPADFDVWIGRQKVLDGAGCIDFKALELQVRDLLHRKPHLAAPPRIGGGVGVPR